MINVFQIWVGKFNKTLTADELLPSWIEYVGLKHFSVKKHRQNHFSWILTQNQTLFSYLEREDFWRLVAVNFYWFALLTTLRPCKKVTKKSLQNFSSGPRPHKKKSKLRFDEFSVSHTTNFRQFLIRLDWQLVLQSARIYPGPPKCHLPC